MNASIYTPDALKRLARAAARGEGKFLRWELEIIAIDSYGDRVRLVTYVRKPSGAEYAIHTIL
jgi:hypothetical protein